MAKKLKIDLLNAPIGELKAALAHATEESLRVELALAVREQPEAEDTMIAVAAALEHLARTKDQLRATEAPKNPEELAAAAKKQEAILAQLRSMLPKVAEGSAVKASLLARIAGMEGQTKYAGHSPEMVMLIRAYEDGLKALTRLLPELAKLSLEEAYVVTLFPDLSEYLEEIRNGSGLAAPVVQS